MSPPANVSLSGAPVPPDDPTDLTREDYRTVAKATAAAIRDDDVPSLAAGVAFKIFLSLFPAAIAGVAIFSIVTTPADIERFLAVLQGLEFVPQAADELITEPLRSLVEADDTAGRIAVAGVLGGLWAASSAAVTLIKALSKAWDVPETRKFVRQRVVALMIMLALLLALIGLFLLLVVGLQLQAALLPEEFNSGPLGTALGVGRFLAAILLLMFLFAFVYWVGPDRTRPQWRWLSPGAVLGVVGWLAASGAFTLYVRSFGTYEATYGTLAGVIVLLLWMQLSMMMLLVGAELNNEVERLRAIKAAVAEGDGFAQAAPLTEAASLAPNAGTGLTLPPVPPPAPGDPLPGLEERGELAATDGGRGATARIGGALAAAGALTAVFRHRRRRRAQEGEPGLGGRSGGR